MNSLQQATITIFTLNNQDPYRWYSISETDKKDVVRIKRIVSGNLRTYKVYLNDGNKIFAKRLDKDKTHIRRWCFFEFFNKKTPIQLNSRGFEIIEGWYEECGEVFNQVSRDKEQHGMKSKKEKNSGNEGIANPPLNEQRTWADVVSGRKISKNADPHLATVTIYVQNAHPDAWWHYVHTWYLMSQTDRIDVEKVEKVAENSYKVFLKDGNFVTAKRTKKTWVSHHSKEKITQLDPKSFEIIKGWYEECTKEVSKNEKQDGIEESKETNGKEGIVNYPLDVPRTWADLVSGKKDAVLRKADEKFSPNPLESKSGREDLARITMYVRNQGPREYDDWPLLTDSDYKDIKTIEKIADHYLDTYRVFLSDGSLITAKRNYRSSIRCSYHGIRGFPLHNKERSPFSNYRGIVRLDPKNFEIIQSWYNRFFNYTR